MLRAVAALGWLLAIIAIVDSTLEVYRLNEFPKNKIALHMPCEESNMFATKCMCHIKCTDPECGNAKRICENYSSKGCKYVLLRIVANKKIATLKRTPTATELKRFDPSEYRNVSFPFSAVALKKRFTVAELSSLIGHESGLAIRNIKENHGDKYCGTNSSLNAFPSTTQGISLFGLNYKAPMTLLNSIRTWKSSGLLNLMDETVMILNDPLPEEISMSLAHGFTVLQPKLIPNAKMRIPNVLTIGAAFYEALKASRNEYVLFLENDFKIDTDLSVKDIAAQLLGAVGMLERGAQVVRLQSRKYKGCGTHKDCDHAGIQLTSGDMMERTRNWFAFYCRGHPNSEPYVSDCLQSPLFRCFTSWDSNWTLNAVLVKKSDILKKKYPTSRGPKSIADLAEESHMLQDAFETNMMYGVKWMQWRVPLCLSYQGLFIHEEIETAA